MYRRVCMSVCGRSVKVVLRTSLRAKSHEHIFYYRNQPQQVFFSPSLFMLALFIYIFSLVVLSCFENFCQKFVLEFQKNKIASKQDIFITFIYILGVQYSFRFKLQVINLNLIKSKILVNIHFYIYTHQLRNSYKKKSLKFSNFVMYK